MKLQYLFIFLATCIVTRSNAQTTTTSNLRPATGTPFPFLGWDAGGTSGTLEIRNNFNEPIDFFTDNTYYMTLRKTRAGSLTGEPAGTKFLFTKK